MIQPSVKKHLLFTLLFSLPAWGAPLVDVETRIPDAIFDIRYHSSYNFVGKPIEGYVQPKCLLTEPAADALAAVQKQAQQRGMTLKIFDCYRPQRAVDHFVAWAEDLEDTGMKSVFYPSVNKADLFDKGYIAAKSGHSRGSTVDLTLVALDGTSGDIGELDMGTPFDFFDPLSHTDSPEVGDTVRKNRLLLKTLMTAQGFENLPEEWWHYTLADEPYPDTYFDVPVE